LVWLCNLFSYKAVVDYIDEQFEAYLQEELKVKRSLHTYHDTRIHACLYFLAPTGHSLVLYIVIGVVISLFFVIIQGHWPVNHEIWQFVVMVVFLPSGRSEVPLSTLLCVLFHVVMAQLYQLSLVSSRLYQHWYLWYWSSFFVLSHTHFTIIHHHFIHANFYFIWLVSV